MQQGFLLEQIHIGQGEHLQDVLQVSATQPHSEADFVLGVVGSSDQQYAFSIDVQFEDKNERSSHRYERSV